MIRKATNKDALELAKLIIIAMGSLAYKFVKNPEDALGLFERFTAMKQNQYSFENTIVWDDGSVRGLVCAYDGADLSVLRQAFLKYIEAHYGIHIQPENETQAGEYYIDCLAVFPENQGRGLGKKLIKGIGKYAASLGFNQLGLLVVKSNPEAKKLYLKTGFQVMGEKTFVGDIYEHLQLEL